VDAPSKEAYMNQTASSHIPRDVAVTAIANMRAEWQLGAGNESLICIRASVGLLLADIVVGLGLRQDEQQKALGTSLFNELRVAGALDVGDDIPALPETSLEWVPEAWVLSEQSQEQ
jgi:hypothetical protein